MIRPRGALAVAVVCLLVGGCGSQASGALAPPAVADAGHVDMCTVLTDTELTQLGIELGTRKPVDRLGLIGCAWLGKPITLDLERDKESAAAYKARRRDPSFVTFAENTVNGRAGAQLSVRGDGSDCTQVMDGGPVSLTVSVALAFDLNPPKIDPCAEALRIAQIIEPRLP
jgi:Protein of unknown function (DUF3558)